MSNILAGIADSTSCLLCLFQGKQLALLSHRSPAKAPLNALAAACYYGSTLTVTPWVVGIRSCCRSVLLCQDAASWRNFGGCLSPQLTDFQATCSSRQVLCSFQTTAVHTLKGMRHTGACSLDVGSLSVHGFHSICQRVKSLVRCFLPCEHLLGFLLFYA